MAMTLASVVDVLEGLAPTRYAEPWDNVGLLVGDPAAEIRRVLVTVDYTAAVAEEARTMAAELVVAYHPPIFAPFKRVPHDALWADALRRSVALYSPHTALDVAPGGTNDVLADAAGVMRGPERGALRPRTTPGDPDGIGLGRVGPVAATTLGALVMRLKAELGVAHALVAGDLARTVQRVAVGAGAGGELLADAARAGADVYVTGELRHHDALAALDQRMAIVALLHSHSERAGVHGYAKRVGERLAAAVVEVSRRDADPFVVHPP